MREEEKKGNKGSNFDPVGYRGESARESFVKPEISRRRQNRMGLSCAVFAQWRDLAQSPLSLSIIGDVFLLSHEMSPLPLSINHTSLCPSSVLYLVFLSLFSYSSSPFFPRSPLPLTACYEITPRTGSQDQRERGRRRRICDVFEGPRGI